MSEFQRRQFLTGAMDLAAGAATTLAAKRPLKEATTAS